MNPRYSIIDCILGEWWYRVVDNKTACCIAICAEPEVVNKIVRLLNSEVDPNDTGSVI